MKNITLHFFSIFFLVNLGFTQNELLLLSIEDASGKKDSVYFGLNENATIGIDTTFGEVNLFGTLYDSTEVRIVRYDELNQNCLGESYYTDFTPIYYSENNEAKIDIRPYEYGNPHMINFEFFIQSNDYPIKLRIEYIEGSSGNPYPVLDIVNQDCYSDQSYWIYSWDPIQKLIEDSLTNTVIVYYSFIASTTDLNTNFQEWKLYPNPNFDSNLNLQFENAISGKISIINHLGKVCKLKEITSLSSFEIDINDLAKGGYYISVESNDHKTIYQTKTFTKQ